MGESAIKKAGLQNIAAGLIIIVLSTVVLKKLDFLFVPFSMALLFCYALGIPIELLGRFKIPNYLRILLIVFVFLGALFFLGKLVHLNILAFQRQLPEFEVKFWDYTSLFFDSFGMSEQDAKELYGAFWQNIQQAGLKPLGNMVKNLTGSFFVFLGNFLWVLLFMIFFLAERESISKRVFKAFSEDQAISLMDAAKRVNKAVQDYLGLKTLVSFITGTLVALILWLLNVPFALLWGVLAFLANFIPNIGSIAASIPPIAMALFHSGSLGKTLLVLFLLMTVQVGVGNFLEPKLMGRGLNLSPLIVLFSLFFWGWMWGLTGMLLAVPLTAAIKIGLEQAEPTRSIAIMLSGK